MEIRRMEVRFNQLFVTNSNILYDTSAIKCAFDLTKPCCPMCAAFVNYPNLSDEQITEIACDRDKGFVIGHLEDVRAGT